MLFTVDVRSKGRNTFVTLAGELTSHVVPRLTEALAVHHDQAHVFIATDRLTACQSDVRTALGAALQQRGIPLRLCYFKGKHAVALAPDGCRIIALRSDATRHEESAGRMGSRAHIPSRARCACRGAQHAQDNARTDASPQTTDAEKSAGQSPVCTGNCATCPRCRRREN